MAEFQENNVSRNLKEYFNKNGLTQQAVANMLGITQAAVSSLLRGKPFGKRSAKIWSDLFGFNYSWLLTGGGEMFKTTEKVIIEHATPDMIRETASEAFEYQLNKLFKDKIIAPYSLIEEKEEEIRALNREIGKLENEIERLKNDFRKEIERAPQDHTIQDFNRISDKLLKDDSFVRAINNPDSESFKVEHKGAGFIATPLSKEEKKKITDQHKKRQVKGRSFTMPDKESKA